MIQQTIGFIGTGQMARALAGGLVRGGLTCAERLVAYDPAEAARAEFAAQVAGARLLADNREVVAAADVVVLAVKPQKAAVVMDEVRGGCGPDKLLVSILAGTPLARLVAGLGTQRVVRVMPNTPCLVGAARPVTPWGRVPLATTRIWSANCWALWGSLWRWTNPCWTP